MPLKWGSVTPIDVTSDLAHRVLAKRPVRAHRSPLGRGLQRDPVRAPREPGGVSAATGALLLGFSRARESTRCRGSSGSGAGWSLLCVLLVATERGSPRSFKKKTATGPAVNKLRSGRQVIQKGAQLGAKGNAIKGIQLRSWIGRTHKRCPSKISLKTGARERAAASAPRTRAR